MNLMSSKLFFRYSCMGAGKSTNLLQVAHNYDSIGQKAVIIKPKFDNRENDLVAARLGISKKADILLEEHDDVFMIIQDLIENKEDCDCVLVDESNFITVEQSRQLWEVATLLGVPVIAYGLRSDYMGQGFPSSKELMILAHEIEEVNKIVDETGKKCTMHLRSVDGEYVFEGDQSIVGDLKGKVRYESCTSRKWLEEHARYKRKRIGEQIDIRGGLLGC